MNFSLLCVIMLCIMLSHPNFCVAPLDAAQGLLQAATIMVQHDRQEETATAALHNIMLLSCNTAPLYNSIYEGPGQDHAGSTTMAGTITSISIGLS